MAGEVWITDVTKMIYLYDALSSLTMIDRQIYSIAKYFIKMKNIGGI